MQSIAEISSLFVTLVGATYAIIQYQNHLKEEKRKVLCEYNQRYSTDKNIKSVITWMLKVAITNEINGDIIDVNTNSNVLSPGIQKKEMFMRFFEELNLRIDKGDLDAKEVYNLFSYYALKFDELWGFRLDIKDYKNEREMISMNENDRKEFKDCWVAYHSFIQKMKDEEKRERNHKK